MRKQFLFTALVIILSMVGCQKESGPNNNPEPGNLDASFTGNFTRVSWGVGDEIGVYSTATRNGEDVQLSVNAKYTAKFGGGAVSFTPASASERIEVLDTDKAFRFKAYFPYAVASGSEISVQVPAVQLYAENYGLYVASAQANMLTSAVNLQFESLFSTIELYVPKDIVDPNGSTVIRSLTIKPAVAENFTGTLVVGGKYDIATGVYSSDTDQSGNEVQVDFGAAGLALTENLTKISLAVAPFTVPEGGFEVVARAVNGQEATVVILDKVTDHGTAYAAGEVLSASLSIVHPDPVTFPVVFPLGLTNGTLPNTAANQTNNATIQPHWVNDGKWICNPQPQAYAQWHQVSIPEPGIETRNQVRLFTNSNHISSPTIRGIWTGDHLEFVLPVRNFAAGTKIKMEFPVYTRFGPTFWKIEYFDGGVWKSNATDITSGSFTRNATFSLTYDTAKEVSETMTFNEAIPNGELKIRFTCVDGAIQTSNTGNGTVSNGQPYYTNANYIAPFYFFGGDASTVKGFTFSVEP